MPRTFFDDPNAQPITTTNALVKIVPQQTTEHDAGTVTSPVAVHMDSGIVYLFVSEEGGYSYSGVTRWYGVTDQEPPAMIQAAIEHLQANE